MTQLALIPPIDLLHYTARTQYQLVLPELLDQGKYALNVQLFSKQEGAYFTILDNGAADSGLTDLDALLGIILSRKYRIHELVLPDVLGSARETWKLVRKNVREAYKETHFRGIRLMAVLQGQSERDLDWLMRRYAGRREINTIGIPRQLIDTLDDRMYRVKLAQWIHNHWPRFAIHFLGGSTLHPREIRHAASTGIVRSMDTSMPFVFAHRGLSVKDNVGVRTVRPERYFHQSSVMFNELLVEQNVNTMLQWARGA